MNLRPYQTAALDRLQQAFERGARASVLCLPTGAGKTVLACEIMRRALLKGRRVLFLVHRVELIDQAVTRLAAFGIEAGVILARREEDRSHAIQVASIQTLVRRKKPEASIVFIDEAHHAAAKTYVSILEHYPDAWLIGLTATPCRLDGRPLRPPFDTLVVGATARELCDAGALIEPIVYSHPDKPNLVGLRIQAGDYEQAGLALACEKPDLVGSIVKHWKERGDGLRTLCFAVSIAHSRMIVADFQRAGIAAEHLDGDDTPTVRALTLSRLRTGEIQIVSNCALFTEGYDLPDLAVAIIARPTASFSLWRQMVGRIMRPAPGKTSAVVLDHAGNAEEHGLPTDETDWSLDGKASSTSSLKTCKQCYAVFEGPYPCPECGYAPALPQPVSGDDEDEIVHVDGKLVPFADRQKWYAGIVAEASAKRYRIGWARNQYKAKFGKWPRKVAGLEAKHYVCPLHVFEETEWGQRCGHCLQRKTWPSGVGDSAGDPRLLRDRPAP